MGTVLITGAAGYIGSQIVHTLHRTFEQPKVIGLDNLSKGYSCPLPHGVECFHGDVGHKHFIGNLIDRYKVDQIIHCAAKTVVPESVAHPLEYYHNNVVQSVNLIETAVKHGVKGFIFSSTAAVYGEADLRNRELVEGDLCNPISPYGRSKLMIERVLEDSYVANGMNTVILRYFNVAGADPLGVTGPCSEYSTHLIPRMVRAGLGLIPRVFIHGDGHDKRDYVHVSDVAAAHLGALEWNARHAGCLTLNVGRGMPVDVIDVLSMVEHLLDGPVPVEFAQRREGDPTSCVANVKKIKERFNWEPQYGLKDIVEHAIQWETKKLPPQ